MGDNDELSSGLHDFEILMGDDQSSRQLPMGWVCLPLRRDTWGEHSIWPSGLDAIAQGKHKIRRDSKR